MRFVVIIWSNQFRVRKQSQFTWIVVNGVPIPVKIGWFVFRDYMITGDSLDGVLELGPEHRILACVSTKSTVFDWSISYPVNIKNSNKPYREMKSKALFPEYFRYFPVIQFNEINPTEKKPDDKLVGGLKLHLASCCVCWCLDTRVLFLSL